MNSKEKSSAEFSGYLLEFHNPFVAFGSFIGLSQVDVFFSDGQTELETIMFFAFNVENKRNLYCNCSMHDFCNINRAWDYFHS